MVQRRHTLKMMVDDERLWKTRHGDGTLSTVRTRGQNRRIPAKRYSSCLSAQPRPDVHIACERENADIFCRNARNRLAEELDGREAVYMRGEVPQAVNPRLIENDDTAVALALCMACHLGDAIRA